MNPSFSANTQAILLLTAPLIAGRGEPSPDLLSQGEYKRLARHLHQMGREPADLLSAQVDDILRDCAAVVESGRARRLLGRGFALSQAIERWQARAIWVVSRADPEYPQRLRERLKEDRPAVLYGCGAREILDTGGLAVVGSRDVDDALADYARSVGRLAARARSTLVSGGARGIDQASMGGALEAGGKACGVLADGLEKAAMNREHRKLLMDGQLVLVSPYDPGAGFNVGNAMQRNKLIYALANAALVVNSDLAKGGTWSGAVEQLEKLNLVPVFVRASGTRSGGLEALRQKGALPWPEPGDELALAAILAGAVAPAKLGGGQDSLFAPASATRAEEPTVAAIGKPSTGMPADRGGAATPVEAVPPSPDPAEALFDAVRRAVSQVLSTPRKESEIAAALRVSPTQAREWLQRLLAEGAVEKGPRKTTYRLPGGLL